MTDSLKTFADLFAYAKRQARIEFIDYSPYVAAWRCDRAKRDRQRKSVIDRYGWLADKPLPVGKSGNGRLVVSATDNNYCAGQYSPTEVWGAVFDYLAINSR